MLGATVSGAIPVDVAEIPRLPRCDQKPAAGAGDSAGRNLARPATAQRLMPCPITALCRRQSGSHCAQQIWRSWRFSLRAFFAFPRRRSFRILRRSSTLSSRVAQARAGRGKIGERNPNCARCPLALLKNQSLLCGAGGCPPAPWKPAFAKRQWKARGRAGERNRGARPLTSANCLLQPAVPPGQLPAYAPAESPSRRQRLDPHGEAQGAGVRASASCIALRPGEGGPCAAGTPLTGAIRCPRSQPRSTACGSCPASRLAAPGTSRATKRILLELLRAGLAGRPSECNG
jgi:hypothetical protein